MELYRLRSFVAVAELGQLTRAAEKLHVSQPALSAQIKALEDELGLALFERTPRGMVLTVAGGRLRVAVEDVLAAARKLYNEARTLHGEVAGKASVGTLSDPDFIRVGEFMSAVVARFPQLELELHQGITGAAMQHVRDGALDASYYYGDLKYPAVAGVPLRKVVYRIAVPAPWCGQLKHAGWDEIVELPWIIPPPISSHYELTYSLLRAHGVEPRKVVEADQEAVISSLVVSGVGIALMREDLAQEKVDTGEICLWKDIRTGTTLWFIYQRARENDPLIRALLDAQKDIWNLRRRAAPPRAAQSA